MNHAANDDLDDRNQVTFRALLHAMADPGRPVELPTPATAPLPLDPGSAAIAAALLDRTCVAWLDAALDIAPVRGWLRLRTGVALGRADTDGFAFVADLPRLRRRRHGRVPVGRAGADGPAGAMAGS